MKFLTLLLIIVAPVALFADHDSINLYTVSDLAFENKFEESAYKKLLEPDGHDYLAAAFVAGTKTDEESYQAFARQFNQTIQQIQASKNFSKKPKKQINFIFETIHEEYFKLYKENPRFMDIQKNGGFNCLTASILYAIVFEELGIPYEIKVLPQHAYVVAYPNAESQIVETTNPMRGTMIIYDRKDKYKMVNELVDYKLVSQEEVDQKGVDQVFSDNYLGEETIDLKEGIGALYFNAAIEQMGLYKYAEAYELYKKSSVLYPKKTTNILLLSTAAAIVDFGDYENQSTLRALADLEKFEFMGVPVEVISEEFMVTASEAIDDDNFEIAENIFVYLLKNLESETIKNEISFIFYYDKAVYLDNQNKLKEAWINLEKAADFDPDDQDMKGYLQDLFFRIYKDESNTETLFNVVDSLEKKNSLLVEYPWFKNFQKGLYLELIYNGYYYENYDRAEELRAVFESKYPPAEVQDYKMKGFLIRIYSLAAMRYFSMNMESRSEAVLKSGLKYAPDSYELQSKLDALKH